MKQLIRFIAVGIINTGIGYGIIFGCMYWLGLSPELSNVTGYMIGLVASYLLHRSFTFRSKQRKRTEFFNFVAVFLIAYSANIVMLIVLVRAMQVHAGLSQVISGAIYVIASYLLSKYYVFRSIKISG